MDFIGLALLLLIGLVLGIVILAVHTAYSLTHPPRRGLGYALARSLPADPSELRFMDASGAERIGAAFEQWKFQSRGVTLDVWELAGCNPDGPTVVLSHGWGESRVVSLCRAPALLRVCRRLILWDFPGHGEAGGTCTLGMREADDLIALVDAMPEHAGPVVLYGHSLGAGASIEAGARLGPGRIAGVIAEAPYRHPVTPARNVLRLARLPYRLNLPLAMLALRPRFDRVADVARVRSPLLVIHGDADRVCPVGDGEQIAAAAPNGKLAVIGGGGHLDLFTDPKFSAQTEAAIREFVAGLGQAPVTPQGSAPAA